MYIIYIYPTNIILYICPTADSLLHILYWLLAMAPYSVWLGYIWVGVEFGCRDGQGQAQGSETLGKDSTSTIHRTAKHDRVSARLHKTIQNTQSGPEPLAIHPKKGQYTG